jgi:hypothetical protein
MPKFTNEKAVAETFLKEMFEADDTGNYALFIKHYEAKDLENFSQKRFESDIKEMQARNGKHVSYEYFGVLEGQRRDCDICLRFVWKGIYEKREALVTIGIHQKGEAWHVHESSVC